MKKIDDIRLINNISIAISVPRAIRHYVEDKLWLNINEIVVFNLYYPIKNKIEKNITI
jgi:hypothetical protein